MDLAWLAVFCVPCPAYVQGGDMSTSTGRKSEIFAFGLAVCSDRPDLKYLLPCGGQTSHQRGYGDSQAKGQFGPANALMATGTIWGPSNSHGHLRSLTGQDRAGPSGLLGAPLDLHDGSLTYLLPHLWSSVP